MKKHTYSKTPTSIRFDESSLKLSEKYLKSINHDMNFSDLIRTSLNSFLRKKMMIENSEW